MANTTTLLTTPVHAKLECDSSTLDTTAERFNTIDQNLDTFASAGISTGKNIFFDTNQTSANNITHLGIWFTNYLDKDNWSGMDIFLQESDTDGSGYAGGGSSAVVVGSDGLFFFELGSPVTKRYLKFIVADLPVSSPGPEIGQLFFLTEQTFNARPEFPIKTPPRFFNTQQRVSGGRSYVSAEAGDHIYNLERTFTFTNQTDADVADDVWTDLAGKRRLFIYQEGTTVAEAKVCRLRDDIPDLTFAEYDFHRLKMRFESLNYIRDGEAL